MAYSTRKPAMNPFAEKDELSLTEERKIHRITFTRMLLLSATLILLLISYSRSAMDLFQLNPEGATEEESKLARDFQGDYYQVFLWLFIPILGLFYCDRCIYWIQRSHGLIKTEQLLMRQENIDLWHG